MTGHLIEEGGTNEDDSVVSFKKYDSGSEEDLDEERILFLPNQDPQEEPSLTSLDPGGLQVDGTEGFETNGEVTSEEDPPVNPGPSHKACDVTSGDLLLLLPNEAEQQKEEEQTHENQPKKLPSKTPPKGKKVQKVSPVDFYKMQMLTTEHQLRMKLMAEEYQRRMEMTRLEHEQRMKNMAQENSVCLERHALEIELIRTKKEVLYRRIMSLSNNNLIFDYTRQQE